VHQIPDVFPSFPDGSSGVPYILVRAADLAPVLCGDGTVKVGEECDDGIVLTVTRAVLDDTAHCSLEFKCLDRPYTPRLSRVYRARSSCLTSLL
jgi:hypothetical protein